MSRVRACILDRNQPPVEYDPSELQGFASPEIEAFLCLPMREQYRTQREHRVRSSWGPEAEQALARLVVLPKSLDGFRLQKAETLNLKRQREGSLLTKNDNLLPPPLLIVSGRRFGEMVNGRSTFAPTTHPYYTLFSGQLKKRCHQPPYQIPLLVPYSTFAQGLLALRQKQNGTVTHLTNAKATSRYLPNVQRELEAGGLLPSTSHVHDCRSVYVAAVVELFVPTVTLPRVAMRILGHDTLLDSLSYSSAKAINVG